MRYFENAEIPWIKVADATASGKYLYETKEKVNPFGASFSRLLKAGSIILCTSGTLGLPIILGVDGCIHDGWLYTYDYKGLDTEFFYYFLQTQKEYFVSVAYGAAIQNINTEILRNTQIRLPPLVQQKRIGEVLKSYDDLIENNRRRMALLEESARLLYSDWFVRLRFPSHEHTKFIESVPEGWSLKPLGDALTLKRGHDLPQQDRVEGSIPIVSSSGITGCHNAKKADPPGVVTGRYGTLGEVYYIDTEYWPLNTALYVSDFKSTPPLFAYYLLQTLLKTIQSDKAAVPGLNRNVVHAMAVLLPSNSLQRAFVEVVRPMNQMISKLTVQNEKLREARDMLLPRLISGEVAV